MTIETHRFRNDTATRKRLMVPESFAHPAKGHLGLWAELIQMYSQPGDLVLDPMAGVGSTLVAALMGRNVICVELEGHFVEPMRRSWEKMRTMPMLGHEMGQVVILRGDSRALPLPDASVGAAITSPPFEDVLQGKDDIEKYAGASLHRKGQGYTRPVDAIVTSPPYEATDITKPLVGTTQGNATHKDGLQRRYTRKPVDAIVTSPPYEESYSRWGDAKNDLMEAKGLEGKYTHPVDAIVTSPPYEGSITGDTSEATRKRIVEGKYHGLRPDVFTSPSNLAGSRYGDGYSRSGGGDPLATDVRVGGQAISRVPQSENIGNLKGSQYFDAMKLCYAECWRVLKPGGLLALVLKGFTRDGVYQDLPAQTEALLLEAGWQKHDHWRRELYSLSFWRILQRRRSPEAFDNRLWFEEVLAFRKPEGQGNRIDAVIE